MPITMLSEAKCFNVIRMKDAPVLFGISKSTMYLKLNERSKYYDPKFPQPIKVSLRARGFLLSQIEEYFQAKINNMGGDDNGEA